MDKLKSQDMEMHLKIIGWLHIVNSAFVLVFGAFVFILLSGIGIASGDSDAVAILTIIGTSFGVFLLLLALPGLLAGYGLLTHRSWARILAIVIGVLALLNIPIGTLIGIYTLWVLFQDDADQYFANLKPA